MPDIQSSLDGLLHNKIIDHLAKLKEYVPGPIKKVGGVKAKLLERYQQDPPLLPATLLALAMLGIPLACYLVLRPQPVAHELSQIVGASLSLAIAVFLAVIGLGQYHRNSREKRIERSMSFWQRANSEPYIEHFRKFVKHWVTEGTDEEEPDFVHVADSDTENLLVKLSIEHVLDFYDEACTAILMGACDEEAMYSYLGPLMLLHTDRLGKFMATWRTKHERPEKWDCLTAVMKEWREKSMVYEERWKSRLN